MVALAFAIVYGVWGSTYLAIRVALDAFPPLLLMGVRSVAAGLLLYAWARRRGVPAPTRVAWRRAFGAGALLFLVGHGALAWSEQTVPSGLAALLSATLPFWMISLDWMEGSRARPSHTTLAGLALGFLGVLVLVSPGWAATAPVDPIGAGALLAGSLAWAAGSLYGRRASLSASVPMATALPLLAGGVLLLAMSAAAGEWRTAGARPLTAASVTALAYLIVFGSITAFTAYTWLLRVSTPARVATFAYVNPIVALTLGSVAAHEPIGGAAVVAASLIVVGVVLVVAVPGVVRAARPGPGRQQPGTRPRTAETHRSNTGTREPAPAPVAWKPAHPMEDSP
jgi:drug/metabolite transporter (DMT)-like permease